MLLDGVKEVMTGGASDAMESEYTVPSSIGAGKTVVLDMYPVLLAVMEY